MLRLGRRLWGCAVGVFALLGFLAVPLGERTGYQHARAILTGGEACDFYAELFGAARRLRARIWHELSSGGSAPSAPDGDSAGPSLHRAEDRAASASGDAGVADASVPYRPGA